VRVHFDSFFVLLTQSSIVIPSFSNIPLICPAILLIYYKKVMGAGYNARDFYANAWRWGMTSYANGGGMAPRPGDILCFGAASANGNFGHVEPIIEVGADYVLVARQNVWGDTHIGKRYARSGNRISAANVQGWIR
nr:CHAP domain-containing protein [Spirosomataceae bacterium]